jgi:SPX domain protein involved in polyphosphate accumulation
MSRFETQLERLEKKYLIEESEADQIREFLRPYCAEDEHNPSRAPSRAPSRGESSFGVDRRGYTISSLYLDSPSLEFHRARERGDAERIKLRVRAYSGAEYATLEIKRRVADIIDKSRAAIDCKRIEESALGLAEPISTDPSASSHVLRFSRLMSTAVAGPTLLLRYEREAWASTVDDYARVTFDRKIVAQRVRDWDLSGDPERWCAFDDHWSGMRSEPPVVLEIKCQTTVPHWVGDLIRAHRLRQQNFSKYSIGIHLTGCEHGVRNLAPRSSRNAGLVYGASGTHGFA